MSTTTVTPYNPLAPSRRDVLFGGAMALTAGVAYARMPRRRTMLIGAGQLDRIVPLKVGNWTYQSESGLVLPPPDQLAQLLYDQQLARTYVSGTDLPIMLLMAYGSSQSGMLQIHRPEICYPASGFRLSATREQQLALPGGRALPIRCFTARSDTRTEQLLYWTRVGDALPVSWAQQRVAVVRSNLAGDIPDGLLVRISTISNDPVAAQVTLERFTRTMLDLIGPKGRRMLIA